MLWWIATVAAREPVSREWAYAAGDVVNVRAGAGEHARLVARVPIGTRFDVEEEGDTWTRVAVADRPAEHAVVGWVRNDLLLEHLGSPEQLLDRAKATEDPAVATLWADRAAALDPWNPSVVAARGEPRGPVWIAQCDGERAWLVGKASPRDMTVGSASTGADGRYLSLAEHDALARALGTVAWYQGWGRYPGRFVTPFVAPINAIDDDEGGDGWVSTAHLDAGTPAEVVIGACSPYERGQVFTTAPLVPIATTPGGAGSMARALRVAETGEGAVSGVVTRAGPAGGAEVAVLREATMDSCGGDAEVGTGVFYSWVAADGTVTAPFVVGFGGDVGEGTGLADWYTWRGLPVGFIFGTGLESVTSVIRVDRQGQGHVDHLPFRYFGC